MKSTTINRITFPAYNLLTRAEPGPTAYGRRIRPGFLTSNSR
ncbi:hypothetical protein [Leptospira noguchii]|nr:hypothetical protein [Leptospira noguchii]